MEDQDRVIEGDENGDNSEHRYLFSNQKTPENLKTNNFEALVHLIKGMMGTGILAMPAAFKNAGIVFGSVALACLAIMCCHCMHMLLHTSKLLCSKLGCETLSYQDLSEYVFKLGPPKLRCLAPWSRGVVKLFLCLTQLGFCVVYLIFVADNIKQVVDVYSHNTAKIPQSAYLAILLPLVTIYSFIRSLKRLAPASIIATLLQLLGLIVIFQKLFQYLPNVTSRPFITSFETWPLYFGTAMFAFEGIGVVLPIENKMKTPKEFGGLTGVLNTGMTLLACAYISVGFYGYLKYGNSVHASITLDMPTTDLYLIVRIGFSIALFLSIGLQYYVAHDIIFTVIKTKINLGSWENRADYLLRIIMMLLIYSHGKFYGA